MPPSTIRTHIIWIVKKKLYVDNDDTDIFASVLAGIGLNVDNEKPTTCLNTFLRELSVTTYQFRREDILAAFFDKFEKFYELFINQGKKSSHIN